MKRGVLYIWLASVLFVIMQAAVTYTDLPDRIAIHFDARGRPNDWASKPAFYAIWAITIVVANGIPLLVGLAMPSWMKKRPHLVNLPRKEYWTATPERIVRASAIMQTGTAGVAVACNVLFAQIFVVVRDFALHAKQAPLSWTLFAPFGVILVASLAYIFMSLFRTSEAHTPSA